MKKNIKALLFIIIVIIVAYLGYHIVQTSQNKKMYGEKIAHIPNFLLKNLQGENFTNDDLTKNVMIMFLYFNSDCDYCKAETEEIVSNIKNLKSFQIIFVSNESILQIVAFQQKYKLDNYNNISVLCDYNNKFAELFELKSIPTSFIYDKKGVLLNKNDGPIKVDYLLKNIKQMGSN